MSAYDTYDAPPRARYDERYDERYDDRYADPRDHREHREHRVKAPESSRALVHRHREENELTVDRAYPPGYSSRDVRRARSAEPGYDDYYDDRDRYYHHSSRSRHGGKRGSAESYYESEEKARRRRILSRQEKIIAAVAGAALALGGKEVYDRHAAAEAEDHEIQRNYLHSAAFGAAGAVAAYQGADFYNKRASKSESKKLVVHRGHDGRGRDDAYYSDDDDDPPAKKGHKKFLESALGVTSLGAAMKALTGGGDDKASQRDGASHRGRSGSPSSVRSGKSGAPSMNKVQKMAMAGLLAGATEAFRIAKEPGSFKGEKAKRVLTAALGAGAIGGAHGDDHNKRDIAESVIGGLLGNRIVHGSKKNIEEDSKTGRSRSRSRLRSRSESGGGSGGGVGSGGLAALASAGLAAFGAKKAIDSRDDSRGRNSSPDRSHRSRSRSVVDGARRGLAKLGFGSEPADDRRRDDASDYGGSRVSRRNRHYSDESDDDDYDDKRHHSSRRDRESRRHRGYDDEAEDRSARHRRKERARSDAGSSTDLGDSEEDERQARKIRGKQIITTGLASLATIHAAHGMYQSIGNRKTRELAVKAGKMSPTDARALKSKAIVQDAASVSLAVLGVKGALEELKEARDKSYQCRRFKAEKQARHDRRVARQRSVRDGHRRTRSNNWASPSAVLPTRERSVGRNGESYAETLPPSPA
ncbi:uncharacterized protein DNG_01318 [Cephalotrichum gorgonifer]|uniref:DUF3824 domain-containing protein n=1 Tax=Cephalotrichum gorgonifer TaxID=2041049 RepID=A0AAE8MRH4_9PEZI|nr:uncharacterized protein DNG_01318 [Cephalotrichum gorgonifer]